MSNHDGEGDGENDDPDDDSGDGRGDGADGEDADDNDNDHHKSGDDDDDEEEEEDDEGDDGDADGDDDGRAHIVLFRETWSHRQCFGTKLRRQGDWLTALQGDGLTAAFWGDVGTRRAIGSLRKPPA